MIKLEKSLSVKNPAGSVKTSWRKMTLINWIVTGGLIFGFTYYFYLLKRDFMKIFTLMVVLLVSGCITMPIESSHVDEFEASGKLDKLTNPYVPNEQIHPDMLKIQLFLNEDKTNEVAFSRGSGKIEYTCGFYARQLSKNAIAYNLTIGSALLSNHPTMQGYENNKNHGLNYFMIDGEYYFIEPQTDKIFDLNEVYNGIGYRYVRFWSDGTMMPSHWRGNRAHDLDLGDIYGIN